MEEPVTSILELQSVIIGDSWKDVSDTLVDDELDKNAWHPIKAEFLENVQDKAVKFVDSKKIAPPIIAEFDLNTVLLRRPVIELMLDKNEWTRMAPPLKGEELLENVVDWIWKLSYGESGSLVCFEKPAYDVKFSSWIRITESRKKLKLELEIIDETWLELIWRKVEACFDRYKFWNVEKLRIDVAEGEKRGDFDDKEVNCKRRIVKFWSISFFNFQV